MVKENTSSVEFSVVKELEKAQEILTYYESIIAQGLKKYLIVGQALLEIRNSKLYKLTHPTFREYMEDRWDIDKTQGYDWIDSCQAYNNLKLKMSDISDISILPQNERQAYWISRVKEPEKQVKGWIEVLKETNNQPTIRAIKEKVLMIKNPKPVIHNEESNTDNQEFQTENNKPLRAEGKNNLTTSGTDKTYPADVVQEIAESYEAPEKPKEGKLKPGLEKSIEITSTKKAYFLYDLIQTTPTKDKLYVYQSGPDEFFAVNNDYKMPNQKNIFSPFTGEPIELVGKKNKGKE